MNGWWITSPWIFYGIAGAVVAYVLYMMLSRRKGERSQLAGREREALSQEAEVDPACSGTCSAA